MQPSDMGRLRILQALLLLMMTAAPVLGSEAPVIAIMSGQTAKPYQQTLESFKASLKQSRPGVEFVRPDPGGSKNVLQPPALVFALGTKAVRESLAKLGGRELVATMILSDKSLNDSSHATAVLLTTSPLKQLEWHRRFLPNARRVGILYDPKRNQDWVDAAKIAAAELGLEIVAVPVKAAKELPSALKLLGRNADSILGIADKTVYSSKTAKAVLLFSFRNRIPFIGLSGAWVKAGALYALDWDYPELGRQCAAIALKILDGTKAKMINPQLPEKRLYLLNLKTAKHMKLEISQALIDGASKVYK